MESNIAIQQDSVLDSLVDQIKKLAKPKKIYLFGSRAKGTLLPDSDFDLMLVMENGSRCREIAQMLYKNIYGIDLPFDLVVTTEDSLRRHSENKGLIYREVLNHGIVLYAA